MRLLPKLLLLMVGVAAIPLGLAGFNSIRISQDVTRAQVRESQLRISENLAASVHDFLRESAISLANTGGSFPLKSMPPGEQRGATRLLFTQMSQVDLIMLLDEQGSPVVPPIAVAPDEDISEGAALASRATRDMLQVARFQEQLPFDAAVKSGSPTASAPYASREVRGPHVAMAVPLENGWVLGAEISLDKVRNQLDAFHLGERGEAFVLDPTGTISVHRELEKVGKSYAHEPFIKSRVTERVGEFTDEKSVRWIAAYAPIGAGIDWGIVVAQPEEQAFVAATSLRNQTILWLVAALLFAVVLAAFYANEVRRPIGMAADAAEKFAGGKLDHRIDVTSSDEVGDLARAFNLMAGKLEASIREIERQNEEIRGWNATLSQKVEERTRALREAQARLVQSKKLAALGELGAGVAHELNNPLAAVKGFAQLLSAHKKPDDKELKHLKTIEEQASRCSEIVTRLLRFSQEATRTAREKIDLHKVLKDALTLVEGRIREGDVKIVTELAAELPGVLGSAGEMREVFWHILSNARNAMPQGGTLTIRTWTDKGTQGEEVKISFADTGKGIDPEIADRIFEPFFTTKTEWRGTGLGLAVVHRIVTDHGGTVDVVSKPGAGATFTLAFPVATADFAEGPKADDVAAPRPKTQLV